MFLQCYDRLSSTLLFAIYELSRNLTEQNNVHKKLLENGTIVLDPIIRETLRIHNPTPVIVRKLDKQGIALSKFNEYDNYYKINTDRFY